MSKNTTSVGEHPLERELDVKGYKIPKYPTHAVRMIDNSMGDGDIIFVFAYMINMQFYSHDTNNLLCLFEGDKILNSWKLNI
jgi:hypothetical protein